MTQGIKTVIELGSQIEVLCTFLSPQVFQNEYWEDNCKSLPQASQTYYLRNSPHLRCQTCSLCSFFWVSIIVIPRCSNQKPGITLEFFLSLTPAHLIFL